MAHPGKKGEQLPSFDIPRASDKMGCVCGVVGGGEGGAGIHIIHVFFLFLHENICCGYSLEVPHQGTSNEYHNIYQYFHEKIKKMSVLLD